MRRSASLTSGPVGRRLFWLAVPMVGGIAAISTFHLADTAFVAQLGTEPLAAMGFTLPVVMLVHGIAFGVGLGAGSTISRAIGRGKPEEVRRLTTDALILAFLIVGAFVVAGLLTIRPLFRLLGATEEVLPLIEAYMSIWYVGMIFVMVPMVGNYAIRATGDTTFPGLIMMFSAAVNVVLDPLMIFGLLGFPRLGIVGAATATVIARACSMTFALTILHFREGMLDFTLPPLRRMWQSWRQILYIGVPATLTNIMVPLCVGAVTRLAARYGEEAVAAVGAGLRIEQFALIPVWALATAIVPFVGQNWGAGRPDRVGEATRFSHGFAIGWGLFCWVGFLAAGPLVAGLFSKEPRVAGNIVGYLWIVPVGYGFQGIWYLSTSAFNAMNRPLIATALNVIRMVLLYVPLAYLGAGVAGLGGMFGGIAVASIVAGAVCRGWLLRWHRPERAPAEFLQPASRPTDERIPQAD